MFNTPILLIVFNRPNSTQKVFEELKKIKPKHLYIAADGPRDSNMEDITKCAETRTIINEINWDCEVKTLFRDENRGCGRGPAEAITWFFQFVEEGIILEDDCLPSCDFFHFCENLLAYYRYNNNIFFIGGNNFQKSKLAYSYTYYFSAGHHGTWGWATWRRAWQKFDYYLSNFDFKDAQTVIKKLFRDSKQQKYWLYIYSEVKKNRFNESCWDYQFYFSGWMSGALAVIPNFNLVQNIGFNEEATHTKDGNNLFAHRPISSIVFPIKHNNNITQNKKADFLLHKNLIQPSEYGFMFFLQSINIAIKKLIGKKGSWLF